MAKIMVMYDTEAKTMQMMKDGSSLPGPRYISFDHYGDMTSEGRMMYSMRAVHVETQEDGMIIEKIATASDPTYAGDYCAKNPNSEKCRRQKMMGKAAEMDDHSTDTKNKSSTEDLIREKTDGLLP